MVDEHSIAISITAMRQTMFKEMSARVVLRGRVEGYLVYARNRRGIAPW